MDDQQRERFRADWLEKYGERIDCDELRHAVRASKITLTRLVEAGHQRAEELARLLETHAQQLEDLLCAQRDELTAFNLERVPGRGDSLHQLLEAHVEAAAREGRDAVRLFPRALFEAHVRRCLASARRIAHTATIQAEQFGTQAPNKATDFAFGAACASVEAWIRARHVNGAGELDSRCSWGDVATCLEWHGHDLRHQVHKAKAYRQAAIRFRRRVRPQQSGWSVEEAAGRIEALLWADAERTTDPHGE